MNKVSSFPVKMIAGIVAVIFVLFFVIIENPFYSIPSGYVGVLTEFGAISKTPLEPGLHFVMPFTQTVYMVSVQPQTVSSNETAATHDLQNAVTSVAVTFNISDSYAPFFYKDFRNFDFLNVRIISPTVSNDVKAITAKYNAEELITKREIVDAEISSMISKSLAPYHIIVQAVNISNFQFSQSFSDAIEQKQVSQQHALQAEYTLQQSKINAQQKVVIAQAEAEAAIETAKGHAKATMIQAQADANAYKLKSQSLTPQILQLQSIHQWNGVLPSYLGSAAPIPFLNGNTGTPTH